MRLTLTFIQKTKNVAVMTLIDHYLKKIRQFLPIDIIEMKALNASSAAPAAIRNSQVYFLHDTGRSFTSSGFANFLAQKIHTSGANHLEFWCGGPEGFPGLELPKDRLISLSEMTFSHELARVMLCEQLYRALCLINRHPYPK